MPNKNKTKTSGKTAPKPSNTPAPRGITSSSAPTAISTRVQSMEPRITRTKKSIRIAHRELVLASVAGSTTFTVQNKLSINPGLAATFPWLAPQAQQWEQYRVHKLDVEYVPIAPTSTQGDLIISPNYDSSDPPPTSEVQAGDNYGSVTDSCWKGFQCRLDVQSMMALSPRRYVRATAIAGDIKTFDVGKIFICTNNETGTSAIGKIYLDYDFEFFTPQNDPLPSTVPLYTSLFSNHATTTFTTTVAKAMPFDTLIFDPLGVGAPVAGVFTPPAGSYLLMGEINMVDGNNEAFSLRVEIQKNSAALSNPLLTFNNIAAVATGAQVSVPFHGVVNCNGTDTFSIVCTVTGAAGTLQTGADESHLIISLA